MVAMRSIFYIFITLTTALHLNFFVVKQAYGSISGKNICTEHALVLNGAGIRTKYFIELYSADLYVNEKRSNSYELLSMNEALCMRLKIISSKITTDIMINAIQKGFKKSTNSNIESINNEINTFTTWLNQEIIEGGEFEFLYVPDEITYILKNNVSLVKIENKNFASALFGIWIGENPV